MRILRSLSFNNVMVKIILDWAFAFTALTLSIFLLVSAY